MEKQTYCSEYGKKKETDIKNRLMDMKRGKRVRYMERVTQKLILPYIK